jgi:ribonuclease HII
VAIAPPRRRRSAVPLRRLLRHDLALAARFVGGADEAGRGSLAGPLVAAAVLLEPAALTVADRRTLARLDDSKRCTAIARATLLPAVLAAARSVCLVVVPPTVIDRDNIHVANLRALADALDGLEAPAEAVLLSDGFRLPLARPHTAVIDGDEKSACVAAASIVAKVTRDRLMARIDASFPAYGFVRHVGYGTPEHLAALRRLGPTVHHRRSFSPCAQLPLDLP